MSKLQDRVALVTGSSRGIGAAIAARLAAEGARVAVHGRDRPALEAVTARIRQAGGTAEGLAADLTDLAQIEAMRERIEATLGPVDILVANAGGSPVRPGPVEDLSEEDWRASVDANLTATFLTVKSLLPGMKQRRRGAIVTMSSAASRRPTAMSPIAYVAAKAGIEQFTRALALQVGSAGIRANCVSPETILTDRNLVEIPPDVQKMLRGQHPIARLGTPDDVAEAVLFLVADSASWITGVVLDVAGGSVLA